MFGAVFRCILYVCILNVRLADINVSVSGAGYSTHHQFPGDMHSIIGSPDRVWAIRELRGSLFGRPVDLSAEAAQAHWHNIYLNRQSPARGSWLSRGLNSDCCSGHRQNIIRQPMKNYFVNITGLDHKTEEENRIAHPRETGSPVVSYCLASSRAIGQHGCSYLHLVQSWRYDQSF